jgi:hypothetical protein
MASQVFQNVHHQERIPLEQVAFCARPGDHESITKNVVAL